MDGMREARSCRTMPEAPRLRCVARPSGARLLSPRAASQRTSLATQAIAVSHFAWVSLRVVPGSPMREPVNRRTTVGQHSRAPARFNRHGVNNNSACCSWSHGSGAKCVDRGSLSRSEADVVKGWSLSLGLPCLGLFLLL